MCDRSLLNSDKVIHSKIRKSLLIPTFLETQFTVSRDFPSFPNFESFSRAKITGRQFVVTQDILNGSNQIVLYLYTKRVGAMIIRWEELHGTNAVLFQTANGNLKWRFPLVFALAFKL